MAEKEKKLVAKKKAPTKKFSGPNVPTIIINKKTITVRCPFCNSLHFHSADAGLGIQMSRCDGKTKEYNIVEHAK